MNKYSTIFIFPGPLGYFLAAALRCAGKEVLVISHPAAKADSMPDIIGAAVYLPEIFSQDISYFGLPEPSIGSPQPISLNIAGREVLLEPDKAQQVLACAHAFPDLDRQLMRILDRLEVSSERMMPRLKALYHTLPGKRSLGRKFVKKSMLFPFRTDPFKNLPKNAEGDIARWALRIPAYLSLGIQGVGGGLKAVAAGYGFRTPHFCSFNSAKLAVEAEHLYLGEGGDVVETRGGSDIAMNFSGGMGIAQIDGAEIVFDRAFIGKDTAARALAAHEGVIAKLYGLTMLPQLFTWSPPRGRAASAPRHGVIVTDINRPPINDNLVLYSISATEKEPCMVTAAVAVEREETMSEHFMQRRRGYLHGRMVGNFAAAMGGTAEMQAPPALKSFPPLRITGRAKFRFLDDNLTPGNTIEDIVRYARWLSLRSEFAM